MKKITLLISVCLLSLGGFAQNQKWATTSDNTGNADNAFTTDIDNAGNRYVAGMYVGDLIIDGITYTNYAYDGSSDAFVAKYNSAGNLVWLKTINGLSNQQVRSVKVNRMTGECYVSGIFYYDFYIDGIQQNALTYESFPGSYYRTFIAKFDAAGNLAWSNNTYSEAEYTIDGAYSIALSPNGNSVYMHTAYIGDVEFRDGFTYLPNGFGIEGMLLSKMDAATGELTAVRNDIERHLFDGFFLSCDADGNLIYAGSHRRLCMEEIDAVFAPCLENPGGAIPQGFVWKMDANFGSIWGKEISGPNFETVDAVATDIQNNIYIYGFFNGNATFDATTLIPEPGMDNHYVAKLNESGNYQYIKPFYANNLFTTKFPDDLEAAFAADKKGNVYLGGGFTGTLYIETDSMSTEVHPTDFYSNGFLIKINKQGNLRWMEKFAGSTGPFDETNVHGIAVNTDRISVAGRMTNYNAYVGDTIYSDNHSFYLSALQDCDITVRITTTSNMVNAMNPATLSTPLRPGYTYQWQRNNLDIPAATSNTYVATMQGNYKCIITTGVCEIPSNRIHLFPLREGEMGEPQISIFPNPATDHITILLQGITEGDVAISLTDMTGRIMLSETMMNRQSETMTISIPPTLASGAYFMTVTGEGINLSTPVIIE